MHDGFLVKFCLISETTLQVSNTYQTKTRGSSWGGEIFNSFFADLMGHQIKS